jgi:hypothetical protein
MGAAVANEPPMYAMEIDCARRDSRGRVTHVGGPGADGRRWMAALETVIAAAARDEARYFVARGAQQLGLRVKDGQLVTMVEDGWSVTDLPVCARVAAD